MKKGLKKIIYTIKKAKVLHDIHCSDIRILTIDETISCLEEGKSIARFGDGEFEIIMGNGIGFQQYNDELSILLQKVLSSKPQNCLIAIPDAISSLKGLTKESEAFWLENMAKYRNKWVEYLNVIPDKQYQYGNAHISRCYLRYQDKVQSGIWFNKLKALWNGKNLVIIEGNKTRLGCGNDFLKEALSIQRILCPSENAFSKMQEIITYISDEIPKTKLLILALGPTASVLAFELSERGYQALDLGHCDIEYEWFRMGVKERVAVQGKYTNEVLDGKKADDSILDDTYMSQIIKRF